MTCFSCLSLSGEKPILKGSRIYEGKFWVVEHAYPVRLKGWLVIVLKQHKERLHELTTDEFLELGKIQEKFSKLLSIELGVEKEYLVCFAEAKNFHHLHFHLIGKPKDLPDKYKGPKIFELMHEKPLSKEEIVAFCKNLKEKT